MTCLRPGWLAGNQFFQLAQPVLGVLLPLFYGALA